MVISLNLFLQKICLNSIIFMINRIKVSLLAIILIYNKQKVFFIYFKSYIWGKNMIGILEKNKTISINTKIKEESNQISWDENESFYTTDKSVKISKVDYSSSFLGSLPYTSNISILLVELQNSNSIDFSFNFTCEKNEYYFAVDDLALKICDLVENFKDEIFEDNQLLEEYLTLLFFNKIKVLKHRKKLRNKLQARLTSSSINRLITYTQQQRNHMSYLLAHNYIKLRNLLNYEGEVPLNTRKFYIVIGELESQSINQSPDEDEILTYKMTEQITDVLSNEMLISGRGGSLERYPKESQLNNQPIVVVVHGLGSSCIRGDQVSYPKLLSYLQHNFQVYLYDYLTINQPIDISAKIFAEKLKELKKNHVNKEIIIVAHSMGGLVSRAAYIKYNAPIKQIITAGTPHKGAIKISASNLAALTISIFCSDKIKYRDFVDGVQGNYKGLKDLGKSSNYITNLNTEENWSDNPYYFIAGNAWILGDKVVSTRNAIPFRKKNPSNYKIDYWTHFNYFERNIVQTFESILGQKVNTENRAILVQK